MLPLPKSALKIQCLIPLYTRTTNIKKFYILIKECIHVNDTYLRTHGDYFCKKSKTLVSRSGRGVSIHVMELHFFVFQLPEDGSTWPKHVAVLVICCELYYVK